MTIEEENQQLKDELARIKFGIKSHELTMIIDGNDMIDWGWMTSETARARYGTRRHD